MSSLYRPETLAEFGPILESWTRGTPRSKLRQFTAVCPGSGSHAVAEVYPPGVLFTARLLWSADILSGSHEVVRAALPDEQVSQRRRPQSPTGLDTATVPAAGMLEELCAPGALRQADVRCCTVIELDFDWVRQQMSAGRSRAVVPIEMTRAEVWRILREE